MQFGIVLEKMILCRVTEIVDFKVLRSFTSLVPIYAFPFFRKALRVAGYLQIIIGLLAGTGTKDIYPQNCF